MAKMTYTKHDFISDLLCITGLILTFVIAWVLTR